jgi:hypothetical protein
LSQSLLLAPYRQVVSVFINGEQDQYADIHFAFWDGMRWQRLNQLFVV